MFNEFKQFIARGNVIDMAVGIVMGAAFTKLSTAFIEDLVMPWVGKLAGNMNFTDLFLPLYLEAKDKVGNTVPMESIKTLAQAKEHGAVVAYGDFITIAINFFILAFVMFLVVKAVNKARKLTERQDAAAAAAAPPEPTAEEKLLTEIRDLLKQKP